MKRFEYLSPTSLEQALSMLAVQPEAAPLAGGTNLLVQIKEGHRDEKALLSLNRISELNYQKHDRQYLRIGATSTMKQVAQYPLVAAEFAGLAAAAHLLGSVQTRNMATIGGNLCNGSPSADTAGPLLAHGAEAIIASRSGERIVPLDQFWLGPGKTVLRPGELLKEVRVPRPEAATGSSYVRHIPRAAMDISVAGVAAVIRLNSDGAVSHARVALGAVAPTPMRALQAEALLENQLPTSENIARAAAAAAAECQPMNDIRASAEYRRHLVNVLAQQALTSAIGQAGSHHKDETL